MFRIEGDLENLYRFSDSVVPIKENGTLIDNFDAQDFNLNDAGWVRNDISALARAQSKAEFDMLMQRLQIQPDKSSIPDDMSVEEALKQIKPRWCQSPNELELWAQMTNDDVFAKIDDAYREALKDVNVVKDGASVSTTESTD